MNENEKKAYQNFETIAKVVLRGKFIAFSAYSRKENRSQTNNLSFLLKKLKIEEQINQKQTEDNKNKSRNQ